MTATATTTLEVIIEGKDMFSGAAKSVVGSVSALESGVGRVGGAFGKLEGALGHAKNQIGGLLSGPLGLIGLGAGLFTVAGAIENGITKAQDFGLEVSKLSHLTGMSVETVSALASAFEHFGISADSTIRDIGLLEKNVGNLAARKDGLAAFAKTFGLALTDASGHVKDANALVLTAADYFNNRLIPAQTKAAALAKLFGRSWQEMIPLLSAGSQGIRDAEAAAKDLGLTLTTTNINDLAKFKESTRDLNTAMGGLELQIGLALMPSIKGLADSLTKFIRDNRAGIVQFFKDAAANVQKFGDFISKYVIPPLQAFGKAASQAWGAIPDPLKQILIAGVIANKAGKFVFNIGLGDVAKGLAGLGGSLLQRGGTPANPLFVSDVTKGLGGGAGSAAEGAAAGEAAGGAEGAAATAGTVTLSTLSIAALAGAIAIAGTTAVVVALGGLKPGRDILAGGAQSRGGGGRGVKGTDIGGNFVPTQTNGTASAIGADRGSLGGSLFTLLSGGGAKVTISDFPKELASLNQVRGEQKNTSSFIQRVQSDIITLKQAEVGATAEQKKTLSADIKALQKEQAAAAKIAHADAQKILSQELKIAITNHVSAQEVQKAVTGIATFEKSLANNHK